MKRYKKRIKSNIFINVIKENYILLILLVGLVFIISIQGCQPSEPTLTIGGGPRCCEILNLQGQTESCISDINEVKCSESVTTGGYNYYNNYCRDVQSCINTIGLSNIADLNENTLIFAHSQDLSKLYKYDLNKGSIELMQDFAANIYMIYFIDDNEISAYTYSTTEGYKSYIIDINTKSIIKTYLIPAAFDISRIYKIDNNYYQYGLYKPNSYEFYLTKTNLDTNQQINVTYKFFLGYSIDGILYDDSNAILFYWGSTGMGSYKHEISSINVNTDKETILFSEPRSSSTDIVYKVINSKADNGVLIADIYSKDPQYEPLRYHTRVFDLMNNEQYSLDEIYGATSNEMAIYNYGRFTVKNNIFDTRFILPNPLAKKTITYTGKLMNNEYVISDTGIYKYAKECEDSDGGLNYVKTGQTKNPYSEAEDTCINQNTVREYFCDSTGDIQAQEYSCGGKCSYGGCYKECDTSDFCSPGTRCINGVCNELKLCDDLDGRDYYTKGVSLGIWAGKDTQKEDYCVDDKTLMEWTCVTKTPEIPLKGIIFQDNFKDGNADGWILEDGWNVIQDNGNYILNGIGHKWANSGSEAWTDYTFETKVKLIQGGVHINFRKSNEGRYFLGFNQDGLYLKKQFNQWSEFVTLTRRIEPYNFNEWYDIKIELKGNNIWVYINNELKIYYNDKEITLPNGAIAFETLDNSEVYIDNIVVSGEICDNNGICNSNENINNCRDCQRTEEKERFYLKLSVVTTKYYNNKQYDFLTTLVGSGQGGYCTINVNNEGARIVYKDKISQFNDFQIKVFDASPDDGFCGIEIVKYELQPINYECPFGCWGGKCKQPIVGMVNIGLSSRASGWQKTNYVYTFYDNGLYSVMDAKDLEIWSRLDYLGKIYEYTLSDNSIISYEINKPIIGRYVSRSVPIMAISSSEDAIYTIYKDNLVTKSKLNDVGGNFPPTISGNFKYIQNAPDIVGAVGTQIFYNDGTYKDILDNTIAGSYNIPNTKDYNDIVEIIKVGDKYYTFYSDATFSISDNINNLASLKYENKYSFSLPIASQATEENKLPNYEDCYYNNDCISDNCAINILKTYHQTFYGLFEDQDQILDLRYTSKFRRRGVCCPPNQLFVSNEDGSASCQLESCSNRIRDNGEDGVDCGGVCPAKCLECLTYNADRGLLSDTPSVEATYYTTGVPLGVNICSTGITGVEYCKDTVYDAAITVLPEYADYQNIPSNMIDTADEYMEAVAWYVNNHMTWMSDGDGDWWQTAPETIVWSGSRGCGNDYCGDCEDHSILRGALLRSLGISWKCVWSAEHESWLSTFPVCVGGSIEAGHVYNIVYYKSKYRIMDYDNLGRYFLMSECWKSHLTSNAWNDAFGDRNADKPYYSAGQLYLPIPEGFLNANVKNYYDERQCPPGGWDMATIYADFCP